MTQKEKAKAYDNALEIARKINSGEGVEAPPDWSICEVIFPELKESEDERIRKALIDGFTVMKESKNCGKTFSNHNIPVTDILAWLEKQGEQKSVLRDTFGYEDGRLFGMNEGIGLVLDNPEKYGLQKPVKWSKEDKVMLDEIIDFFENGTVKLQHDLSLYASWLKFLKERYTWKPSKGHMKALNTCIMQGEISYVGQGTELQSLYNDLKKLTE